MTGLIIFGVYVMGMVILIYPTYSAMLSAEPADDTQGKVLSLFMAVVISLFWPAIVVGLGMYLVSHRIWVGHWIPKWLRVALEHTPQDAVDR